MPQATEKVLAFRKAAVAAGFRTIGAEFCGSGDEGSIDYCGLPSGDGIDHTTPVAKIEEECGAHLHTGDKWDQNQQKWVNDGSFDLVGSLAKEHGVNLNDLFYSVLVNFPGDWVNNEGGYGKVFLDLVNGEYYIDGYQRIEHVESADASGVYFNEVVQLVDPVVDTSEYIKSLLG